MNWVRAQSITDGHVVVVSVVLDPLGEENQRLAGSNDEALVDALFELTGHVLHGYEQGSMLWLRARAMAIGLARIHLHQRRECRHMLGQREEEDDEERKIWQGSHTAAL